MLVFYISARFMLLFLHSSANSRGLASLLRMMWHAQARAGCESGQQGVWLCASTKVLSKMAQLLAASKLLSAWKVWPVLLTAARLGVQQVLCPRPQRYLTQSHRGPGTCQLCPHPQRYSHSHVGASAPVSQERELLPLVISYNKQIQHFRVFSP